MTQTAAPQKTILNDTHRALGAKMVDFGGWDMPMNYGSQIEEHHQVRRDAGMFDVSHMTVVDLHGARTRDLPAPPASPTRVDKLQKPGKALYTCMLNAQGGVIDDLIIYFLARGFLPPGGQRRHARQGPGLDRRSRPRRSTSRSASARSLSMIAVQGPNAREKVLGAAPPKSTAHASPSSASSSRRGADRRRRARCSSRAPATPARTASRSSCRSTQAVALWNALLAAGVKPAGLGARDTLRLEAGMNLYGQDMDETVSPYEAALAWTVALDEGRDFIGRAALESQKAAGAPRQMIGLVMDEKGVLRHGQTVLTAAGDGEILSGTFSPTLGKSIAFARVPAGDFPGRRCVRVDIRGRAVPVRVVKFPFVRDGQAQEGV